MKRQCDICGCEADEYRMKSITPDLRPYGYAGRAIRTANARRH